jgi:hypothetical protein
MSVKIGTTASGTYSDGPGLPMQNHLVYAENAGVWWYFTVSSASDSGGNPGTHTVKAYYSSGSNLNTATWTAASDSPNFNASGASGFTNAKLNSGYSLACNYRNNSSGTTKDVVVCLVTVYNFDTLTGGSGWNGLIRATVTNNAITWSTWGGYTTPAWNNLAGHTLYPGNALARTTDGYLQAAGMMLHSELDASVVTTLDADTGDAWTVGGITATANVTNGSALVTAMSNQTGLKVGMAISDDGADWTPNRFTRVNSIDSGTQVTANATTTPSSATGVNTRWSQLTAGINRSNILVDTGMANECQSYFLAPLASNGMLLLYDDGAATPPNVQQLRSFKANQTQANGFWPTAPGTGVNVFGSNISQYFADYCVVPVDTTHIYACRKSGSNTVEARVYSTAGDTWSALAAQPPAVSGGTIGSQGSPGFTGSGLIGVTDGVNFTLFVIDSTNNAIKYCTYSVSGGSWDGTWTTVETVSPTAKCLSCTPAATSQGRYGLIYSAQNGSNWDTFVSTIPLAPASVNWFTADRIAETSTTTGAGDLILAGAVSGFRAFSSVCTDQDRIFYAIVGATDWEVGLGTWNVGNTLSRTNVIASSNSNALVSFTSESKQVFLDHPAQLGMMPVVNNAPPSNTYVPPNASLVLAGDFTIPAGVTVELGAGSFVELL